MKKIFLLAFFLSVALGYGQTVYRYYVDLDNYSHAHPLTKVNGKMVYTGAPGTDKTFFDGYDILEFYQPFPDGIDIAVRKHLLC